jgi:hypothetical protein
MFRMDIFIKKNWKLCHLLKCDIITFDIIGYIIGRHRLLVVAHFTICLFPAITSIFAARSTAAIENCS